MTSAVPSGLSGMKKPFSNLPDIGAESIGKLRVGEEHWYLQQRDHLHCVVSRRFSQINGVQF